MRRIPTSWVLVVLSMAAGCGPHQFRAETVLQSDGSVERAIFQPAADTPDMVKQTGVWTQMTYALDRAEEEWTHPIRSLPPNIPPGEKRECFAAWGRFASAAAIPEHFLREAPGGLSDGKLERELHRNDYGLVVEFVWQETLTDVVTLEDMQRARTEFADLAIRFGTATLQETVGPEIDISSLKAWAETEGVRWLTETTNGVYDHCIRPGPRDPDELQRLMAGIAAEHGLTLTDADGKFLEGDAAQAAIREFVARLLRTHLRTRSGGPLSDQQLTELLIGLGLVQRAETGEEAPSNRLELAANAVLARDFGGVQAFQTRLELLATRILGLYMSRILAPPQLFTYQLQVPGMIVETDGELQGENEVLWRFEDRDAYPAGFTMRCRALQPRPELIEKLLKHKALQSRSDCLRFVALLESDQKLKSALLQAVEQSEMQPLYNHYQTVLNAEEPAPRARFERLWRLLKLPEGRAATPAGTRLR